MTTTTEPTVLTIEELAALLRVSLPTAYGAVQRGEVPGAVQVGRVWRLHRASVMAWLESGAPRRTRRKSSPARDRSVVRSEVQGCARSITGGDK